MWRHSTFTLFHPSLELFSVPKLKLCPHYHSFIYIKQSLLGYSLCTINSPIFKYIIQQFSIIFVEYSAIIIDVVFESLSRDWLFATPWTVACQASLSITNSWSLLKLMSIELVMTSNHLILCQPLLLLPSILPSIRVFSNESVLCIRWPKYWSFGFSISPSNEYSGLISLRMDWFDLLAVQGTLKSILQTTVQKHQFFGAQPFYGPTLTSIHDY